MLALTYHSRDFTIMRGLTFRQSLKAPIICMEQNLKVNQSSRFSAGFLALVVAGSIFVSVALLGTIVGAAPLVKKNDISSSIIDATQRNNQVDNLPQRPVLQGGADEKFKFDATVTLPFSQQARLAAATPGKETTPKISRLTSAADAAPQSQLPPETRQGSVLSSVAIFGYDVGRATAYVGGELWASFSLFGTSLYQNVIGTRTKNTFFETPDTLGTEKQSLVTKQDSSVGVSTSPVDNAKPTMPPQSENVTAQPPRQTSGVRSRALASGVKPSDTKPYTPIVSNSGSGDILPTSTNSAQPDNVIGSTENAASTLNPSAIAPLCSWQQTEDGRALLNADAANVANEMDILFDLGLMKEPAIRLDDGTVFLPKATQRLLQIRTGYACDGAASKSRRLIGHVIADPSSSGLVQASQSGRIAPSEGGLPRLGQNVQAGDILGYLIPSWSNSERTRLEEEIAGLRGEIAEKELELARTRELPFLPFRQGRILSIRLDLDKLRRRRDALLDGLENPEALVASTSGVIAQAQARIGQVVEAKDMLWEIVDPKRIWVEAEWYGNQSPTNIHSASAIRADETVVALQFEAMGWSLESQATPLQFQMINSPSNVRLGEPVNVLVQQGEKFDGKLLPRDSLVRRSNGEMQVWVATEAEMFEPRLVRWRAFDGDSIVVEDGLEDGARVVISGAFLLAEVR